MNEQIKYSLTKFNKFSVDRQIRKIIHLTFEIEKNWIKKNTRKELLLELKKLISFVKSTDNMIIRIKNMLETTDIEKIAIRDFKNYVVPLQQKYHHDLTDKNLIIFKKDFSRKEVRKFPLYIVLDNLRSAFNVGSIFRTAECFGVTKIFCCGYTLTPNSSKLANTAMGTEKLIDWEYVKKTEAAIKILRENIIKIYALELTSQSKDINNFNFNSPVALILGNEALGISEKILDMCDDILFIPLFGNKNSLNVNVAMGIATQKIVSKWEKEKINIQYDI